MRAFVAAALIAAMLLAACGGGGGPVESAQADVEWAASVPHMSILRSDSIGIELGDSNLVFGQIVSAMHMPDSSIAVLDLKKCSILIYSADGSFLEGIGRQGSGPGEFLMPSGMTCMTGGGIAVSDAMARRISFFDAAGVYARCLEGFFPTAPVSIAAVDSGAFVGLKPEFEQNDDGMMMGFSLARWDTSTAPTVTYFSDMAPFDPENLMASYGESMFSFAASATNGRVFRAPMSSEAYSIDCYEPDGTLYLTIEEPYTPIPKTPEEIADETAMVEERMASSGAPAEMINWEPEPNRAAIAGLYLDRQDRLWVRRGWVDIPTFDVFDQAGQLLFVAAVECEPLEGRYWQVSVDDGGILAFSANPTDYPRLYMLELQE